MDYLDFVKMKQHYEGMHGFDPVFLPDILFPFQKELVTWSTNKGRSAEFCDTGLGKTPIQLTWAENIVRKTNKPVLLLTPFAVANQIIREAEKFGIPAVRSYNGEMHGNTIHVANYERLHYFDPHNFGGVSCDESSILKNFKGKTKQHVTSFMKKMPYRLLATATASPNDFIELGTSSEALGYLGYVDMLTKFFKNDQNTSTGGGQRFHGKKNTWRFKGHAEEHFWRWVVSWARAVRKPSDLGYSDDGYILPELIEREHVVKTSNPRPGELFDVPATNFQEQRQEARITIESRCELAAELLNHDKPAVAWAYLNDEGDLLEKLIPDAVQVKGSQPDEKKEEILQGFADGQFRVLVTKMKITQFGLNWQHAKHSTFFASHSYEGYYQGVRRLWRFGQKDKVTIDNIVSEGERGILENRKRKAKQADRMFSELVRLMQNELNITRKDNHNKNMEAPKWL